MDDVESDHSFELKAEHYVEELTAMADNVFASLPNYKRNGASKTEEVEVIESTVRKGLAPLTTLVEKFHTQCVNFIRDQLRTLRETTPAFDKLQELR